MRRSTSFILLFVSLAALFAPKRAARACGFFVAPSEFRFWLLQPDLTNQYDLTPFFFGSYYLYRGDMWLARETYPDQNINEWFQETKGKATKKDIDILLNETDPQDFFNAKKNLSKQNSLMRLLLQPSQKELYNYMLISKKVEQIAANPSPWGEKTIPKQAIHPVITEAEALRSSATSGFVKFRTAYQLTRLYGYGQTDKLNRAYDTWIEPVKTKSWIKSAALYQKALAADGRAKDYLLSKVFDRGDYNRTPCLIYFNSNKLDDILPLAKNQHERNVLYAMKAFNYPGRSMVYIQRIYKSEPAYKDLPFLLLREINKVEDWLVTNKVTDFGYPAVHERDRWDDSPYLEHAAKNYANDKAYAHKLYSLLWQIIDDKKARQLPLLNLYAAHLSLLLNDPAKSEAHLAAAAAAKPVERNVQTQVNINRFLLQLEKGFDEQAEKQFMNILNKPAAETGIYDAEIMKNQLVLYTARKLIQKGDKAKGLMLLSRTDRALGELPISDYKKVYQEIEEQAAPADYDEILRILSKKTKTPFERFISAKKFKHPAGSYYEVEEEYPGQYSWDQNRLLDCKASWYLRQQRLPESYAVLKQIPDSFWKRPPYSNYITGNAFFLNVYHSHSRTSEDKRRMNKKEIVQEMIYLEELAKKNNAKTAECYFQLANAWYNMSYYGKHWLMVRQWRSNDESTYYMQRPNLKHPAFQENYYGCKQARLFYEKALAATNDKKLKTLCYFMVQQCHARKSYYYESPESQGYWPDFKTLAVNQKNLKKNNIDAEYYKELVEECELYQSFIGQYNRKL